MPYSDGLDSFAAARLTSASQRGIALILVTTGRKKDADRDWRIDRLDGRRGRISVPFRLSHKGVGHEFRESSFRSRAFVFGVMAGIAAHLSEALRVIIPESGQGIFGPWLLPIGNEAPDLHSHPLFSRRLAHFLNLAIDTKIRFEHPRRWHTKGETLLALAEQDLASGWAGTHSCARRSYHVSLDGHRAHCGVCAACLLRRQSILKAGLNEAEDRYVWRNLSVDCLEAAVDPTVRSTTADDNRHAACGVLALAQLAEFADSKDFDHTVEHSAFELAPAAEEPTGVVQSKLARVVRAHRDEWRTFVASQGSRSFISEWASAIAC
jgi:7-cyano-7-deazaguanine synthase in queuosine biosynthesis